MNPALRIVVVAPELPAPDSADADSVRQAERSRGLRIALLENGFNLMAVLPSDTYLRERIAQLQPDLIIVDAESEARDALEHVVIATRDERRPIVMFTNDGDSANARHAVAAGVSAYIVAGLSSERIRPILDVAMARFEQEQALRRQLADTRSALDARTAELQERKVIDRAKGMLMQRHQHGRTTGLRTSCARARWTRTCAWSRWRSACSTRWNCWTEMVRRTNMVRAANTLDARRTHTDIALTAAPDKAAAARCHLGQTRATLGKSAQRQRRSALPVCSVRHGSGPVPRPVTTARKNMARVLH